MRHPFHRNPVRFNGAGSEFFGIWIVNILLSIVTLGIYSAWAKVRTKRYFYGQTSLAGDNFEYHAKPIQILKGRIVAFILVAIWVACQYFYPEVAPIFLVVFYLLLPWMLFNKARFDCAMTSYRNVRFYFDGTASEAYRIMLLRPILALIGLVVFGFFFGIMAQTNPIMMVVLSIVASIYFVFVKAWIISGMWQYFVGNVMYGNQDFYCDIETKRFAGIYFNAGFIGFIIFAAIGLVLYLFSADIVMSLSDFESLAALATQPFFLAIGIVLYALLTIIGVYLSAYVVTRTRNYVFENTSIDAGGNRELRLDSNMSSLEYGWLIISNFILQLITVGLARPWVMVRTSRYLASCTTLIGDLSVFEVEGEQAEQEKAMGDEIAEAFDFDFGLGT